MKKHSLIPQPLFALTVFMALLAFAPFPAAARLTAEYVEYRIAVQSEADPEKFIRAAMKYGGADEQLIDEAIPLFFDQDRPEWRAEAEAFVENTTRDMPLYRHAVAMRLRIDLGLVQDPDPVMPDPGTLSLIYDAVEKGEIDNVLHGTLKRSQTDPMLAIDQVLPRGLPYGHLESDTTWRLDQDLDADQVAALRRQIIDAWAQIAAFDPAQPPAFTLTGLQDMVVLYLHQTGDISILPDVYDLLRTHDITSDEVLLHLRHLFSESVIVPMYYLESEEALEKVAQFLMEAPEFIIPSPSSLQMPGPLIDWNQRLYFLREIRERPMAQRLILEVIQRPPCGPRIHESTRFRTQFARLLTPIVSGRYSTTTIDRDKQRLWEHEVEFHDTLRAALFPE